MQLPYLEDVYIGEIPSHYVILQDKYFCIIILPMQILDYLLNKTYNCSNAIFILKQSSSQFIYVCVLKLIFVCLLFAFFFVCLFKNVNPVSFSWFFCCSVKDINSYFRRLVFYLFGLLFSRHIALRFLSWRFDIFCGQLLCFFFSSRHFFYISTKFQRQLTGSNQCLSVHCTTDYLLLGVIRSFPVFQWTLI